MSRFVALALLAVPLLAQQRAPATSQITIASADGASKQVIFSSPRTFEAPNWSPDGKYLLLNCEGKLWRLDIAGGEPVAVPLGAVNKVNNDHGISPDGKWFAVSAQNVFVAPSSGGDPRQLTQNTPSYFHGWSPDGKTLAYCAKRDDNFDIYTLPFEGGEEKRLTTSPGYDDGPDYSPDGKWIYFNSDRSGSWDIWRMPASGAGPGDARAERISSDDYEDWFPHPSPDSKWIVFISFPKGTKGHPANQNVILRRMPMKGGKIEEIHKLFGGQGTMNVNSWSPDSKRFAFVAYELRK
jgi:TolB protein